MANTLKFTPLTLEQYMTREKGTYPFFATAWLSNGDALIGGGGGRAGAGVPSGILVGSADITEHGDEFLRPSGEVLTHDVIVDRIVEHPRKPEVVVACGLWNYVFRYGEGSLCVASSFQTILEDMKSIDEEDLEGSLSAYDTTGQTLAVCGEDQRIRIFKTSSLQGQNVSSQALQSKVVLKIKDSNTKPFRSLSFNCTTTLLASCSREASCKIWVISGVRAGSLMTEIKSQYNKKPMKFLAAAFLVPFGDDGHDEEDVENKERQEIESNEKPSVIEERKAPVEHTPRRRKGPRINSWKNDDDDDIKDSDVSGRIASPGKSSKVTKQGSKQDEIERHHFIDDGSIDEDKVVCALNAFGGRGPGFLGIFDVSEAKATAFSDQQICSREVRKVKVDDRQIVAFAMSRRADKVAVATVPACLTVYSLPDLRKIQQTRGLHEALITSLSFSPDGDKILTASADKTTRVTSIKSVKSCCSCASLFKNLMLLLIQLLVILVIAYYVTDGEIVDQISTQIARLNLDVWIDKWRDVGELAKQKLNTLF